MAELEKALRELFGESVDRLSQFQKDQLQRVTGKVEELARKAVHDELQHLRSEVETLRQRVARLEAERVEATERVEMR